MQFIIQLVGNTLIITACIFYSINREENRIIDSCLKTNQVQVKYITFECYPMPLNIKESK